MAESNEKKQGENNMVSSVKSINLNISPGFCSMVAKAEKSSKVGMLKDWLISSQIQAIYIFKSGLREGGVTENASYYIFTQAADGAFEAFPVEEWYNFQTIQRYKALSIEEAEEEFNARNRTFNLFNVMMRKRRMKKDDEGDEDGEEAGEGKGREKKAARGWILF